MATGPKFAWGGSRPGAGRPRKNVEREQSGSPSPTILLPKRLPSTAKTSSGPISEISEIWQPHAGAQTEFCECGESEALFGGSAGPGKTDCLIAIATNDVGNPRYRGLLLRRTFPQLQEIIDRCYQRYPSLGAVYRSTEHRWYFPGQGQPSLSVICSTRAIDTTIRVRITTSSGLDELTQFTEKQYTYMFSRAEIY
jgi:hypothetical protein